MPGVSGGERKRVSVGHELLINPAVIILDEPTRCRSIEGRVKSDCSAVPSTLLYYVQRSTSPRCICRPERFRDVFDALV